MITLTPITTPEKLEEYYRFRYQIYSESRLKDLLVGTNGLDKDEYDDRAWHFGWYVNGLLVGCVRFVEPDESDTPLPMHAYLTDEAALDAVSMYITMRKAHGHRMIEASRFCLASGYRGLSNARDFVLAMDQVLHGMGIDHGLFGCTMTHKRFYQALGFNPLQSAQAIAGPGLLLGCTMCYDHALITSCGRSVMTSDGSATQPHRQAA